LDLLDIKKAINTILKNSFPTVTLFANEVEEGFDKPAFFTQLIPVSLNYETVNFMNVRLMVVINYYTRVSVEVDNLKMAGDLKKAFGMALEVKYTYLKDAKTVNAARYLKLENITTDYPDRILQFKFDLNYLQNVEKIDNHELMLELHTEMVNIEKRG